MMRRREFITLLGGAAAWPIAARAQQGERVRRIGVLMNLAADDPESSARLTAFVQTLAQLGWIDGRNLRLEIRWGAGNPDLFRRYAMELVALAPEVIVAASAAPIPALLQATSSIPIVFAQTPDPVGLGYVSSLARPGGNITGFMQYEFGLGAKWLEILKQNAPRVSRVGLVRDLINSGQAIALFAAFQTVAPSFGIELTTIGVRDATVIAHDIDGFARKPNGGLVVTGSPLTAIHRDLIVSLAAKHHLPAIYPFRYFTTAGGLISYGPDTIDQYRGVAGYVDRILKGEKPADLPVQAPTKYELVINIKTAKALDLDIPATVYARADEVIE
jgi:putative ABC transport system substrate-binding protein